MITVTYSSRKRVGIDVNYKNLRKSKRLDDDRLTIKRRRTKDHSKSEKSIERPDDSTEI